MAKKKSVLLPLAHFTLFLIVVLYKAVKTFHDAKNTLIEVLIEVLFSVRVLNPATNLYRQVKNIIRKTSIYLILLDALIPEMYRQFSFVPERGFCYLEQNLILGPPRIRQIRIKPNTCKVYADFENYYPKCYAEYSTDNEDKTIYFDTKYATKKELRATTLQGNVHDYSTGGFVVQLTYNMDESIQIIQRLRDGRWVDRATRVVLLEMNVFNWRTRIFGSIKYVMELMPAGGMVKSIQIRTVGFNSTLTKPRYVWQVIFTVLFLAFFFEHAISSVRNLVILKRYDKFCSWVRILLIFLLMTVFGYDYWHNYYARVIMQRYRENRDEYVSIDYLITANIYIMRVYAVIIFIMSCQILRVLSYDKSLLPLYMTIKTAVKDTISFSFMFMIIFLAYTYMGQNLFGTRSEDFALFGVAAMNILKTINAEFDYGDIEEKFPVFGPFYFICNMLLFFIILMNMFLSLFGNVVSTLGAQRSRLDLGHTAIRAISCPCRCIKKYLPKSIQMCKKKMNTQRQQRATTEIPNSGFYLEGEDNVYSKIYTLVAKPKSFTELLALKIDLLDNELKRIIDRYEALDKTFKLVNSDIESIMNRNKHPNYVDEGAMEDME